MAPTKTCAACGLPKDAAAEFWADTSRRDGRSRACKTCVRERQRKAEARKQAELQRLRAQVPAAPPAEDAWDRAVWLLQTHGELFLGALMDAAEAGVPNVLEYAVERGFGALPDDPDPGLDYLWTLGQVHVEELLRRCPAARPCLAGWAPEPTGDRPA